MLGYHPHFNFLKLVKRLCIVFFSPKFLKIICWSNFVRKLLNRLEFIYFILLFYNFLFQNDGKSQTNGISVENMHFYLKNMNWQCNAI